jgi:hypothetical protein
MNQQPLSLGNERVTALAMRLVEENVIDMPYAIRMIAYNNESSEGFQKPLRPDSEKGEDTVMDNATWDRAKSREELRSVLMQYVENAAEYHAEGKDVEKAKAKARRKVEKDLEKMYKEIEEENEKFRERFPWLEILLKDAAGGHKGAHKEPRQTGGIRFVDGMDGDTHTRVVRMQKVLMQFGISGETNQEPLNNNVVIVSGGMDDELDPGRQ